MGKNGTNWEKGNKEGSDSQKERFGKILFPCQAVPDYREYYPIPTDSNKSKESGRNNKIK